MNGLNILIKDTDYLSGPKKPPAVCCSQLYIVYKKSNLNIKTQVKSKGMENNTPC